MIIKIKKLKHGISKGTIVPVKQHAGNVGRWAEQTLANNGHTVSNNKGVDLTDLNVEVKTRKNESTSHHTVATSAIGEIENTDYFNSIVYEKFQQQYRVHYSDQDSIVTEERMFDFTDPYIQTKMSEGYEIIRQEIRNGNRNPYIPGNGWLHAENTESGGSYRFRIPNGAMKKFESMAANSKNFNNMFDYE